MANEPLADRIGGGRAFKGNQSPIRKGVLNLSGNGGRCTRIDWKQGLNTNFGSTKPLNEVRSPIRYAGPPTRDGCLNACLRDRGRPAALPQSIIDLFTAGNPSRRGCSSGGELHSSRRACTGSCR